jgi:nicotinamide-nucleotide adenylyltransferase
MEAVHYILERVDELIMVVGSSQHDHELMNPFTAGERITMVRLAFNESRIEPSRYFVVPVPDVIMHSTWFSELRSYVPSFNTIFSNEALTRRLVNEAGFSVENVPLFRREIYWSTEIRKRMISGEKWSELVPKSVAEYIINIDGVQRIIDLERKDISNQD